MFEIHYRLQNLDLKPPIVSKIWLYIKSIFHSIFYRVDFNSRSGVVFRSMRSCPYSSSKVEAEINHKMGRFPLQSFKRVCSINSEIHGNFPNEKCLLPWRATTLVLPLSWSNVFSYWDACLICIFTKSVMVKLLQTQNVTVCLNF